MSQKYKLKSPYAILKSDHAREAKDFLEAIKDFKNYTELEEMERKKPNQSRLTSQQKIKNIKTMKENRMLMQDFMKRHKIYYRKKKEFQVLTGKLPVVYFGEKFENLEIALIIIQDHIKQMKKSYTISLIPDEDDDDEEDDDDVLKALNESRLNLHKNNAEEPSEGSSSGEDSNYQPTEQSSDEEKIQEQKAQMSLNLPSPLPHYSEETSSSTQDVDMEQDDTRKNTSNFASPTISSQAKNN
jgi:hypothetical protein